MHKMGVPRVLSLFLNSYTGCTPSRLPLKICQNHFGGKIQTGFCSFQVSWIRSKDSYMLYIGDVKFVDDDRFSLNPINGYGDWTLRFRLIRENDAGKYECQISTSPKLSQTFTLNVVGKELLLKVLEYVSFFLEGQKVSKNSKHWSNDQAAQQSGTILRGLTQPLNAYGYKYFSLLLLLFYPFVVPADRFQLSKSAAAYGLTYSDSIDKKVRKIKI
jgi:hypothetical protein